MGELLTFSLLELPVVGNKTFQISQLALIFNTDCVNKIKTHNCPITLSCDQSVKKTFLNLLAPANTLGGGLDSLDGSWWFSVQHF